jgi:SAM-dependent methyltransferase
MSDAHEFGVIIGCLSPEMAGLVFASDSASLSDCRNRGLDGSSAESALCFLKPFTDLISKGGPSPDDYDTLTAFADSLSAAIESKVLSQDLVAKLLRAVTLHSLQGTAHAQALLTPHGYHGDFEMIDAIYQNRISAVPHLGRWDLYFQSRPAAKAVRNRKSYFHSLLDKLLSKKAEGPITILNIASGPCRDVKEWIERHSGSRVRFDCVEMDINAIAYAKTLCHAFSDQVHFHHSNALRFHTIERYDLVWSAGLFDYLNDRLFVRLLRRMIGYCKTGGEIVVGNFGDHNPTRNYMEMLGWKLIHRESRELLRLAHAAGLSPSKTGVEKEPEGVNLFVRGIKT